MFGFSDKVGSFIEKSLWLVHECFSAYLHMLDYEIV
jgi:hypothetical protein